MNDLQKTPIGTMSYLGSPFVVPDEFCWSFAQMVQYNAEYLCGPGEYIHLERSTSNDRSMSRNKLAGKFLGEWLLMLDTDHTFDPDLVLRLLTLFDSWDLDVLTGVYVSKAPPYPPLIHWRDPQDGGWRIITEWSPSARLIEIGRSGGGCLLIRRRVLERIYLELKEEPFTYNEERLSEDFSFYRRLEKLGIKAHCACQVNCQHLLLSKVDIEDFRKRSDEMEMYIPKTPVPTGFVEQMCNS